MVIIRHPTSTITAEVHMASDISTGERNTTMNQEKYDDEYLRSVQEGLEKILEDHHDLAVCYAMNVLL